MWYPCGVHVIPMRCTCDTHEVCMWYPCGVHVISRWLSNGLLHFKIHTPPVEDFRKVYHNGSVHVIPMRCPCDTHVVCMWYPWGVLVIPMRCACDTHVVCMWYPGDWAMGYSILKSIHPHGRFHKSVHHKRRCEFSMNISSVWFFLVKVYHRGSKYII